MKKLFTSLVVASTAATLAACGKKATTTDTKTTTTEKAKPVITKGSITKGDFKIGYAGSNTAFTKNLKDTLTKYTQDATTKKAGDEYFKLPSGLSLLSSDKFNSYVRESQEYKDEVNKLRTYLLKTVRFGVDNTADGYPSGSVYREFRNHNTPLSGLALSSENKTDAQIIIILDTNSGTITQNAVNALAAFKAIFSPEKIAKLYEALKSKTADKTAFLVALSQAHIGYQDTDPDGFTTASPSTISTGTGGVLYINSIPRTLAVTEVAKTFKTVEDEFKTKSEKALDDKTKLAGKNLDALFVQVTDGVENSAEVHKAVVERKEFGATKLFFIGDKAKSQSGASSKVFAGGNVSTASFNKYAAAYVAGFQAAVGTIKYSSSEDVYEETTTSFLIGSTSDSEAKKKAFAFRRGVEAAAAHSAYSKYLKVKFVSKTEDSSKSSKKLYREVSEWKSRDTSVSKLYEFSSSDTFSDAARRVIYLAGTTARDWTGLSTYATAATNANTIFALTRDDKVTFNNNDDTGLIGALYNYKSITSGQQTAEAATQKTFSRGVWVILDKAKAGSVDHSTSAITTDNDYLVQQGVATPKAGITPFERHEIKFYGAIGEEVKGTTQYATAALKGLYMGGPNYMLGKHTIFGAPLNRDAVTPAYDGAASTYEADIWTRGDAGNTNTIQGVWTASKPKDSVGKAKDRFDTSLTHAWEKEVTEAELVKASPWLK